MKASVITILNLPQSVEVANRCVASAAKFGIRAIISSAWTRVHGPLQEMHARGWSLKAFAGNPYSRMEPCVATFLSHADLWWHVVASGEPMLILEHDAVFIAPLPDLSGVEGLCNLGAPSFGKFRIPDREGLGPLFSKSFLPGAHAYYITPKGAGQLLKAAREEAAPTDVFIHLNRFPWLQEYTPWPIRCEDAFTTIQQEEGCKAKHNRVTIIEV